MWYSIKLKGGALYLSLIIGIVISLFLGLLVVLARYNHTSVLVSAIEQQLKYDLQSGINMALSPAFSQEQNNRWLTSGKGDSIKTKKLIWGAYQIIGVSSGRGKFSKHFSALYGTATKRDTALVVEDNGRPISVSGKIEMNGNCYLPSPDLRPAFIEGLSFNGISNSGFIKSSPRHLPELNQNFVQAVTEDVYQLNPNSDSIVSELRDWTKLSFTSKTAVWQSAALRLHNVHYAGNIKMMCDEVLLEKDAFLEDVLIIADKVRIKEGFHGSVHIIARDSIIVEDSCVLRYPSSLVVAKNKTSAEGGLKGIYIGKNSVIQGSLICYAPDVNNNEVPRCFVKLNQGCEVYGLLYTSGYLHLQGKLFGNAYGKRLMVKSNSATYENHWIDTYVNPVKHSGSLMVAMCFNDNQKLTCCKSY